RTGTAPSPIDHVNPVRLSGGSPEHPAAATAASSPAAEGRSVIKVGLIGAGGIASAHIRGDRQPARPIRVTAVADAVDETALRRGAELGATPYTDYRELLANEDVDAVDICLPHFLHRDAIVAAAEAGRHILCEKPLCLSAAEAADVRRAVTEHGVTLSTAHIRLSQ